MFHSLYKCLQLKRNKWRDTQLETKILLEREVRISDEFRISKLGALFLSYEKKNSAKMKLDFTSIFYY